MIKILKTWHNVDMTKKETSLTQQLRWVAGADLADYSTKAPKDFNPEKALKKIADELSDQQERLFANGKANPATAARVLLVLQGMDTSGKGGTIRHAIGCVDPQGVDITSFKAPTKEELAHHYLWRIEKALPKAGMIGIFDRSHYEDVLVVRVDNLVPKEIWEKRYQEITDWEANLSKQGYLIIKCFLHVSKETQKQRLLARLENPEKYWKYNPGDLQARSKWDAYQEAYFAALSRCHQEIAPWYVVPADDKTYRNWAVAQILLEHLRKLNLEWPSADFDIKSEKLKVSQS